jgi:hypothetical protein
VGDGFMAAGEFDAFGVAFYTITRQSTTRSSGYGDIVMSPRWHLLGPQAAASGTLAFGWSTVAIVTVVIRLVRYRHRAQVRDESRGRSRETREPSPSINKTNRLRLAHALLPPGRVLTAIRTRMRDPGART